MARRRTLPAELTPQAKLNAAIKSARDVMRKDAGLSGDLDRIPQLAWLLFLKAFDALEQQREVTERDFRPAIEAPYRWRDWAADQEGATGPELITFVSDHLLPYLRSIAGAHEHDPRDTLAAVFKETYNRMLSGYLLRDVVDQVEKVNFASSDDIHTMAHLYESMLREVRDAAGDSGEFYTPRPVIRFLVQQVTPRLGETILDPACGTGGFLVEALEELRPEAESVEQWRELQASLRGIEKKPLPYLLGTMNLLLHGVERPEIVRDNALAYPVTQIRRADKVDVVLTNPPFGGEEERVIQANFPDATRTAETALLFVQLIQRRLNDGGRCGMVVPNPFLSDYGVAAKVRQRLLEECDVHTIVRLPPGVFSPYTDIPTNLIFFDKSGRTREVWYFEVQPPDRRRKYAKTRPLRFEEFGSCQAWWGGLFREGRVESEQAWRVPVADIEADGWDLDRPNPHRPDDVTRLVPRPLIVETSSSVHKALSHLNSLEGSIDDLRRSANRTEWRRLKLREVLSLALDQIDVDPNVEYPNVGVLSFGRGLFEKEPINGALTSAKKLFRIRAEQFLYSKLFAFEGAYASVPEQFDGYLVSSEFPTFNVDRDALRPDFLSTYFRNPVVWRDLAGGSKGLGLRRQRVQPDRLLDYEIWVPSRDEQDELLAFVRAINSATEMLASGMNRLRLVEPALLTSRFSVE